MEENNISSSFDPVSQRLTLNDGHLRALRSRILVCAPMVKASDIAFRIQCKRHGTDLAFSPMFYADLLVKSEKYRKWALQTCKEDSPLVVQLAGSNKHILLEACQLVEAAGAAAVDLNWGCPLPEAKHQRFGSYMLENSYDRNRVVSVVEHVSASLGIPLFCKIRVLPDVAQTVLFCRRLEAAGAAMLTIHARQRGARTQRRYGPVYFDVVRAVKAAVSVPVVVNGLVASFADAMANLAYTGADGVMSGEALLADPALFAPRGPSVWAHDLTPEQAAAAAEVPLEDLPGAAPAAPARLLPDGRAVLTFPSRRRPLRRVTEADCDCPRHRPNTNTNTDTDADAASASSPCPLPAGAWDVCGLLEYEPDDGFLYDYGDGHDAHFEQRVKPRLLAQRRRALGIPAEDPAAEETPADDGAEEKPQAVEVETAAPATPAPDTTAESTDAADANTVPANANTNASTPQSQQQHHHHQQQAQHAPWRGGVRAAQGGVARALEYVGLARAWSVDPLWVRNHVKYMCADELVRVQVRDQLEDCASVDEVERVLLLAQMRKDGNFVFDVAAHEAFERDREEITAKRRRVDFKRITRAKDRMRRRGRKRGGGNEEAGEDPNKSS